MHSHSGEMLEWLKRHAWKACIRQNRISGSNPKSYLGFESRSLRNEKTAAFLWNAAFFAPPASSSLAKPEVRKSHDMLRISAVLSQPFLLVARAPRRAVRECAALQGEHNPDGGAWQVFRLQARLQSRRRGKAMICSAYQPFCPSRSFLLQGPPRRAVRECAALQGEHNPDERARLVLRLQARLQSRRRGKAMICSAYQPFCPSRSSLLQGPRGEHNPDGGAWQVFRLQARLQSRRRGMRRKNGNLSYYFPPHSHLASFGIIDNQ